jgi:hypothetical protein
MYYVYFSLEDAVARDVQSLVPFSSSTQLKLVIPNVQFYRLECELKDDFIVLPSAELQRRFFFSENLSWVIYSLVCVCTSHIRTPFF